MKLRITGGVFATVSPHRDAGVWANRSCRAETRRTFLAQPDCAYCVCHPFVALVPYGKTAS